MDFEILVLEAKNGNKNALEKILEGLRPFILKQSKSFFINGYETEDLIQIGYFSAIKAIKSFDIAKQGRFLSYVTSAIKNNYYYQIRQKFKQNSETSLNRETGDGIQVMDLIFSDENIEENMILKEEKLKLIQAINILPKEDIEFINSIYFLRNKLKTYSVLNNISYSKCIKHRNKILKKLYCILNNKN